MFLGMDAEELWSWTTTARSRRETVEGIRDHMASAVAGVRWTGPDAETFRQAAALVGTRLDALVVEWEERLLTVEADIQEQILASEPDTVDAESAGALTINRHVDQPGNPVDAPGDYVTVLPEEGESDEEFEGRMEADIAPDRVEQGSVGDCGLMSALMAVAQEDPGMIRDNMRYNGDGTWTVTFFDDGEPVEITVDSSVPANGGHSLVPAGLNPDGTIRYESRYSWVSIYEKAAAEYTSREGHSGYGNLDNGSRTGEYLSMLTPWSVDQTNTDKDFDDIRQRKAEGMVLVGTERSPDRWYLPVNKVDDPTIVPEHIYEVAGFIPAGVPAPDGSVSDEERIQLRNPWGPDGGGGGKLGELYLTERQYEDNFQDVASAARP